ncbi:hypothetical protein [Listeria booriae]|uniref:hypothetical protein n=1 Tax=Listeria booriae TaxID=1552123 RepID=UPI001629E8C6|nr:hypothetical protein [Listeria booriae]MBC1800794.1 hypothetical protein [Listeria booriae]MBC1803764.1 hypothetical protein [Listeria booriae]
MIKLEKIQKFIDKGALWLASVIIYIGLSFCLILLWTYLGDRGVIEFKVGETERAAVEALLLGLIIIMAGVAIKLIVGIRRDSELIETKEFLLKYSRVVIKLASYAGVIVALNFVLNEKDSIVQLVMLICILAFVIREIVWGIKGIWKRFNKAVDESQNKVTLMIAFFGTLISLLAIFK